MISDQMFKEAVLDISSKLNKIALLLEDIKKLNERRPMMKFWIWTIVAIVFIMSATIFIYNLIGGLAVI